MPWLVLDFFYGLRRFPVGDFWKMSLNVRVVSQTLRNQITNNFYLQNLMCRITGKVKHVRHVGDGALLFRYTLANIRLMEVLLWAVRVRQLQSTQARRHRRMSELTWWWAWSSKGSQRPVCWTLPCRVTCLNRLWKDAVKSRHCGTTRNTRTIKMTEQELVNSQVHGTVVSDPNETN